MIEEMLTLGVNISSSPIRYWILDCFSVGSVFIVLFAGGLLD